MQLDPSIYIFITLKDSCSVYNFGQIFCFEHAILKYRQNLGTRFKLVRVWIASLHGLIHQNFSHPITLVTNPWN